MKVLDIRTLDGPNVYDHLPVLVARLDLEDLAGKESYEAPGFIGRLLDTLPGLREHHCALGRPGGFVERLNGGTYFGHTVEHVAIELSQLAGIGVNRGKTVEGDAPGVYLVTVRFQAEQAMRHLLHAAVELVQALVRGGECPWRERVAEAQRIAARTELGPSTRAIVDAAERRGIPWFRLDEDSLVQLGYGRGRQLVQAAETGRTPSLAVEIAGDKERTKALLRRAEVPVPRGEVVHSREEAIRTLEELHIPVAVKPLDGNQGRGVSLGLNTPDEVAAAYDEAAAVAPDVIVEELFQGRDYRVLVVDGKVAAASEREPAHVVG